MGNAGSSAAEERPKVPTLSKLSGSGWRAIPAPATWSFRDANEDRAGSRDWRLEVTAGDEEVETPVTGDFFQNLSALSVDFQGKAAGGGESSGTDAESEGWYSPGGEGSDGESGQWWRLSFSTVADGERFSSLLNLRRSECAADEEENLLAARGKAGFGDYSLLPKSIVGLKDPRDDRWMDVDEGDAPAPPPAGAVSGTGSSRLVAGTDRRDAAIRSLTVGAGERSYLLRDGAVEGLRNVLGGVEDLGLKVKLDLGLGPGGGVPSVDPAPSTPGVRTRSARLAAAAAVVTPPPSAARGTRAATPSRGAPSAVTPVATGIPPRSPLPPSSAAGGTPLRALLAGSERRLNILAPGAGTRLWTADLESEKVVGSWDFRKDEVDLGMLDVVGDTKAAQLDDRSTLLGIGKRTIARWDLRTREGVVAEEGGRGGRGTRGGRSRETFDVSLAGLGGSDGPSSSMASALASPSAAQWQAGKTYATRGLEFTAIATSGEGHVVTGAADGSLRLYSAGSLSVAKSAIEGMGKAVTAVDVTYDAGWVIATTDKYIIVLKTGYTDPATGAKKCGFVHRMDRDAPSPRLLRLKPSDVARTGGAPIRSARFAWVTESDQTEAWIVASIGRWVAKWNFRVVKTAPAGIVGAEGLVNVLDYSLIPASSTVLDARFVHHNYARRGLEVLEATEAGLFVGGEDAHGDDDES